MVSFIWVWIMPFMISHGKTLLNQNFQLPYLGLVVNLCLVFADHLKYLPVLQFSRSVMSDSLRTHGLQHTRPPCPSPTPGAYSNSRPSRWWCHPTILSSVVPSSSHLPSFPASGLFQWVGSSHQVAKVLEFQLQYQSFQWIFRTDFL